MSKWERNIRDEQRARDAYWYAEGVRRLNEFELTTALTNMFRIAGHGGYKVVQASTNAKDTIYLQVESPSGHVEEVELKVIDNSV